MIGGVQAQQPGLLLLDESTNHLDIHHQLSILSCVRNLKVTTGRALHDLNQAMTCDQVAVLSKGRLVAYGPEADTLWLTHRGLLSGHSCRFFLRWTWTDLHMLYSGVLSRSLRCLALV